MFTEEMARYRIEDRVREADAYRAARSTRTARTTARQGRVRRIAGAVASALLWPVKH